jgi:hypothetical protein
VEQACSLFGAVADRVVPSEPGYLGLIFDHHRQVVRRRGLDSETPFDRSRLWWEMMILFEQSREVRVPLERLERLWDRVGRDSNVYRGTVYAEISELRKALAPLGVTVGRSHRSSWRLEVIPR